MRPRRSLFALVAALLLALSVAIPAVSAASMRTGVFRLTLTGNQEATPTST